MTSQTNDQDMEAVLDISLFQQGATRTGFMNETMTLYCDKNGSLFMSAEVACKTLQYKAGNGAHAVRNLVAKTNEEGMTLKCSLKEVLVGEASPRTWSIRLSLRRT
jgi:hypothetical protein